MNKKIFSFLFSIAGLAASVRSSAQMVVDNVFLQGKYVEVGIAPNGGYGSNQPAPAGYHPNLGGTTFTFWDPGAGASITSSNFLGFVADYGADGWTVGTPPYFGDFYLPGTPQEGWAIEAVGQQREAYIPNYWLVTGVTGYTASGTPTNKMNGTNIAYYNAGTGITKGVWRGVDTVGHIVGTDSTLLIRQTTTLDTSKLYFTVNVVLVNQGTHPLTNIYYIRTVDPDDEETWTGSYTTDNVVTYQLPNPGNKVLVSASGTSPTFAQNAYLGLGTKDCRAKATIFDAGLSPEYTLDAIYNETTSYIYTQGTHYIEDVGIGLVYNIGTIPAGDSTELTYAYILNASYIDSALNATTPDLYVNSDEYLVGDTINLCDYPHDSAYVSVGSGGFYSWHWSPSILLEDSTGHSNIIDVNSIVGNTTYTITGVNVSGGCDTVQFHVTFTRDTFSTHLYNNDTAICIGGSVQGHLTGPIHLNYTWTPVAGVSDDTLLDPVFTPTVTTTYTGTASSASGCPSVSKSFTIAVYDHPTLTIDSSYVHTCVGVPVQLHVNATPADTPYTYVWAPVTGLSSGSLYDPVVTPAIAGNVNYNITVFPTAIPGCLSTTSITVHAIQTPVLNNDDTIICLGHFVYGSITGDDSMSYTWSPAADVVPDNSRNPVITPTTAGIHTYVFSGTYAHCPVYMDSFRVEVDTPATPIVIRDTICLGMTDSFNFTVPGGDYYHYQWTVSPTGLAFSNDTIPNPILTPGSISIYTVTVNVNPNAPGCGINDYVYLDVLPNAVSVNPVDTSICKGAVVQIFGSGDPNFSYQWIPTAGIANNTQLNTLIHPDTTALYTVVASFHRCPDMYATSYIDVEPTPSVFIGGNRFKCVFDTIHITATVSPADYSSYSYVWTPAAGLDNTTSQTVVYNGAASEWVYVTVNTPVSLTTDSTCRAKDSAYITVYPGPGASITNMSFCPHDSAMLMPTPSTVSYHWYPPLYLSDSMSATPVIHPVTTQVYTVVATTDHGCSDTLSFTATVYPAATILMPDSVDLSPGDSYSIEPITNCVTFNWFPPTGLSSTIISNPVATPAISTKYLVTATTDNGCVVTDSINIIIDESTIMALANAFTPGNGINNVFKAQFKGPAVLNYFRIFNRWGNLIYETKNIDEGWDGNFHGQAQPQGVYVYEVQAVTESGKVITKQGNITLIR